MQFNIIEPHEINTIYYGFNKDSIFFDDLLKINNKYKIEESLGFSTPGLSVRIFSLYKKTLVFWKRDTGYKITFFGYTGFGYDFVSLRDSSVEKTCTIEQFIFKVPTPLSDVLLFNLELFQQTAPNIL